MLAIAIFFVAMTTAQPIIEVELFYSEVDPNVVKRSTTWLQRSKKGPEHEQNACTSLCCLPVMLWYVTIRCGTLCCMAAAARHNVATETPYRHSGTTRRRQRG